VPFTTTLMLETDLEGATGGDRGASTARAR